MKLSFLIFAISTLHIYCQWVLYTFGRNAISPEKHLYTFLWFVGYEVSSYRDCADRFDLSLSVLFDIITRVSDYLVDIAPQHIHWPNEEEREITKIYFQQIKSFPNVIGCIDGTHIRIDRPKESAESYYNRKDFFSIQMQIVCNHEHKIIDVFIRFPGSVHDSRVLRNSPLIEKLLNPELRGWLLGDSAYLCLPTLMTPYKDNGHLTAAETSYNTKLSSCRVRVEHTIGILKQR
ncbi:putative nuclease HARBI1 isoform X2 [Pseudomyrmex gracilis]|uniref:putative nuclease HARBI1 isoform X2 n=1 Tax=Pseudomyrmex gracilis TaxID=219809 RepID=UPI00099515C0|nr:putative nuclease HARBI1 isoform X2 [Pseudomyrmex gracilis]